MPNIAIIGAGAAGFFAAINLKRQRPDVRVTIYESATKVLGKVAITGGGRCNVTNTFRDIKNLSEAYPRGEKLMKRIFRVFDHEATYNWFEAHGIKLVVQDDQCVFPLSQDAMQITNMFQEEAEALGIRVQLSHCVDRIETIQPSDSLSYSSFMLYFKSNTYPSVSADVVIVTSGGCPKHDGLPHLLGQLPVSFVQPVPSLFSFQLQERKKLSELMGTVVEPTIVRLQGTKLRAKGALLITHWGMSGPAILKLSSYAARILHEQDYKARLSVNWTGESSEAQALETIHIAQSENLAKQIANVRLYGFTSRFWQYLLQRADLQSDKRWSELGQKGINRLVNVLTNDEYHIDAQNKHKEEFVTCGGIALSSVNPATLECQECPNLYFAGEVLDVDAITGGFNLQAAWSMGHIVAQAVARINQ